MSPKLRKIQYLLISYLMEHGQVNLLLPDGVELSIGMTQRGENDSLIDQNYCWVEAMRDDRKTLLDRYVSSIQYTDEVERLVIDQHNDFLGHHTLEVV